MRQIVNIVLLLIITNQPIAETTGEQYVTMPELFYEDNFDDCMLRQDEALFCSIHLILKPLNVKNVSETWSYIMNLSSIPTNYRHDHLRHFICIPKSCPRVPKLNENDPLLRQGIENCYNEKYAGVQLKGIITAISCQTSNPKYPVDGLDISIGILFITYIFFVLYATYYGEFANDTSSEHYKKTSPSKFLLAFSLTRNWHRLNTITITPQVEKLRSIQGIRFYNSAIVVLSHTILCFVALPIANTTFVETIHKNPMSIVFACAHLCMTTSFFISSFLLSNDIFKYLNDKKGLTFKTASWIFTARLFRQLPALAVVISFHATWIRHVDNGPHWDPFIIKEYEFCRKNWWTNLLFINNLIDPDHMCLSTSWWLALSTQYVVLSLLYIWALKKYENYFALLVAAPLSLNVFGAFLENYIYDFPSLLLYEPESWYDLRKLLASPQIKYQLRGFIGNLAGPIVGIAFGFHFNNRMNGSPNYKFFNTKLRIALWWITILGLGLGCVIVPGLVIFLYSNEHSAFWASVYIALSRPLFAYFLGVLLLGFSEGIGWIALRICCWPPTYILGRLTYGVYLVQLCIILLRPATSRFPVYISIYNCCLYFSGDMAAVYLIATLLTLFIELPASALQKMIFFPTEERVESGNKDLKKE